MAGSCGKGTSVVACCLLGMQVSSSVHEQELPSAGPQREPLTKKDLAVLERLDICFARNIAVNLVLLQKKIFR